MAEYNKKWADLFPVTIGNQTRPSAGVDNTLQYETDKFPQHIANDPVRYDKMNAVVSQAMSNDERLNEKINKTSDDLAAHNKDPKAHATGISGNAATATKLKTPRTLALTGKAAGSTTFDGSANASINVTSVNADTATKLSTARKINITGNATGAANFDGSADANISVTVNESKHATMADNIVGRYLGSSGDGGKRGPDLFGKKCVGFLMSNQAVNGHNEYKDWLYMDNYDGTDVGGTTAIGVSRTEPRAYIMNSNANRKQWDRTAELLSSASYNEYAPTKTGTGASGTWDINISGNAANDGNGANIANTYLKKATVIDVIYPVGSIYMSMSATNPATLFGVGTWARISQGRMLLGADDSTYKAGATGGEATHTLTANEMPAHSHGISTSGNHSHKFYGSDDNNGNTSEGAGKGMDTGGNGYMSRNMIYYTANAGAHTHTISNSGGGAAHNNMPPYLVCYMWQRTA